MRITKHSNHIARERSNGRAIIAAAVSRYQGALNRVRMDLSLAENDAARAGLADVSEAGFNQIFARLDELDNLAIERRRELGEESTS